MYWRNNKTREKTLSALTPGQEIIVFDTETTGLNTEKERIIELAAIKYRIEEDLSFTQIDILHKYIRPPFMISDIIINLTGITNEKLSEHPYEEEQFDEISNFFGYNPLVSGHNVGFDIGFMNELYKRNRKEFFYSDALDTLEMSRDILGTQTPNHKLGTVANFYGLDEGVEFHSAIEDTKVTAQLLQIFHSEYSSENSITKATNKIKARVCKIQYWESFRGMKRIYVETDMGSVFYDIIKKTWGTKDAPIEKINMDALESDVLRIVGVADLKALEHTKPKIIL